MIVIMQSLELKIPPPIIAVLVAIAMWGISFITPLLKVPTTYRLPLAMAIAVVGGVLMVAGNISFRQAKTTVNPMKPESASSLVSSGVYRFTRNPMYLGMLTVLFAWAVFLSSSWSLFGLLAFFLYIDRFQIAPEEKALTRLFGTDYAAYQTKVRRWI
jgi:protein-S-isoprenylcysteine O-methyltransferase Ste14